MSTVAQPDNRVFPRMQVAPNAADARCALSCLERLLARRRRLAELGLCSPSTSCAWHARALDRAIVSYLSLAEDLGLAREAEDILAATSRLVDASDPRA